MTEVRYDSVVIGAGAAGMAAALEIAKAGFSCVLIEREDSLGGILPQCIHNGFGLHEFGAELTGPEFAELFEEKVSASTISVFLETTVFSIVSSDSQEKEVFCSSAAAGVTKIVCRAIVLAMGCRERNRGNIRIPGTRPSGVYTAGLAQRLVNIEGYIPGKNVVIIGSGDIGLIMARRMSWIGCTVKAVIEIMPYPSGLTRNIVQCLNDFGIPLYLSCQTSCIYGNDRVEGVEVTPLENGAPVPDKSFRIACDTVLLSVGLIPENELSKTAGIELNPMTSGPLVDSTLMTNVEGIFACGNVLHVHDLADWVAQEARQAGQYASAWLNGIRPEIQCRLKAGTNVRYVNPGRIDPSRDNTIFLRSLIVKNDAVLEFKIDHRVIRSEKKRHIQPSEMITFCLGTKDFEGATSESVFEISLA